MQQLTGQDDLFLRMETDSSFGHVSSVSILDPSSAPEPITLELVKREFGRRLHLLPMCRRRVVEVPFELDHPYWIDDPDFDIDNHITAVRLPKPGSRRQLQRVAAKIVSKPLDRSRPLWHTTLVTGIEGGRFGLLTRIHHAAIDGLAGNDVLTTLMDEDPRGREIPPAPPWCPEPIPDSLDLLGLASVSLAVRPLRYAEFQFELADAFLGALTQLRERGSALRRSLTVPPAPFNHTITSGRVWEFRRLPLESFRRVKNAFGYTVNDVVVAICAGALRRWLIDHDVLPALPLVAGVPVSIRTADDHAFGNRVSMLTTELATHVPDPLDRLHAAHDAMAAGKDVHRAIPATLLQDWAEFATPAVAEIAIREAHALHVADWAAQPYNLIVSNVPGPAHPLYFAGARLEGIYPLSALADGQGLNISLLGYRDALHFGLLACPEVMPDLDDLADYLAAELRLLDAAAAQAEAQREAKPNGNGRATALAAMTLRKAAANGAGGANGLPKELASTR